MAAAASKPESPTSHPVVEESSSSCVVGGVGGTHTEKDLTSENKEGNEIDAKVQENTMSGSNNTEEMDEDKDPSSAGTGIVEKVETPTYQNVEKCKLFVLAKKRLNEDDFEGALEQIEKGIQENIQLLVAESQKKKDNNKKKKNGEDCNDGDDDDDVGDDVALHESMAKWHYLYGTTLLYSIEESSENQEMTVQPNVNVDNDNDTTTTTATISSAEVPALTETTTATTTANSHDNQASNKNNVDNSAEAPANENNNNNNDDNKNENNNNDTSNENEMSLDVADDMQIAWENLETARSIIERMIKNLSSSSSSEKDATTAMDDNKEDSSSLSLRNQLQLDLAQCYLREGDLQRMNGRYDNAIQDYQSCLTLRKSSKSIGRFDRTIADTHYNMALTYMLQCSEPTTTTTTTTQSNASSTTEKTEQQQLQSCVEWRMKGSYHYLECSKCLCGQIAQLLCNVAPEDIISSLDTYKEDTDGDELKDKKEIGLDPKVASEQLQTLRSCVKKKIQEQETTTTTTTTTTEEEKRNGKIHDLCELLDEIQETIDEAETSAKGVQEVSKMKAAAAAAAAGEDIVDATTGITTTIGFGSSSSSTAAEAKGTNVVGTATTSTTTATNASNTTSVQQPPVVMMIKKKKKRPLDASSSSTTGDGEQHKRCKPE